MCCKAGFVKVSCVPKPTAFAALELHVFPQLGSMVCHLDWRRLPPRIITKLGKRLARRFPNLVIILGGSLRQSRWQTIDPNCGKTCNSSAANAVGLGTHDTFTNPALQHTGAIPPLHRNILWKRRPRCIRLCKKTHRRSASK